MSIQQEIKSNTWIKNWSGNWRLPFASLYHVYTIGLKKYIGKNLKTNLLLCEPGVSSNYIAKKELDQYCRYIADLVVKENKIAKKWANDTISTAKQIFNILKKLEAKKNLNLANLLDLKQNFYLHIPPHFSMKKVVDYLPPSEQEKLMPQLVKARLATENLFNAVDSALRLYAEFIASRESYNSSLTEFLTIEEIEFYLEKNKLPNKSELQKRSRGTGIFCQGNKYDLLVGEDYKRLEKLLVNKSAIELKGNIAYPGIAKGIVRVIFNPSNVKKFNKGDILITGMTRPEFLPLMKKAAAFVTDAGGLLSHAAIVARELKKPCLIATETATKNFKNGDLVEVDADKGVVRILKRKK